MQGFERADRQPLDAGMLAGHLIPAGSMFAFLAAHRAEVFRDADYADLFAPPGLGRPSLPAAQTAAVLTLQVLCDYSDRETAGAELDEPAASALALLALVAGQDVEPAEGSDGRDGRWRIKQGVAEDRVISTVDPGARHTRKSPEAGRGPGDRDHHR